MITKPVVLMNQKMNTSQMGRSPRPFGVSRTSAVPSGSSRFSRLDLSMARMVAVKPTMPMTRDAPMVKLSQKSMLLDIWVGMSDIPGSHVVRMPLW